MSKWEIIPIDFGTLTIDKSEFTYLRNSGEKIDVPCIVWLVTDGERQIIVDTGPPDTEFSTKYHFPLTRTPEQEPEYALRSKGCDPDKVEVVILSHVHWDHAYNNDLFKNAEFIVQGRELRYAIDPLPIHMKGYESMAIGMAPNFLTNTKLTIIHGDKQLTDGIFLFPTPGHTPGIMSVAVETAKGTYVIATDTVPLYENWNWPSPHMPHLPSGIHWELKEYFESFKRIEEIADFVLPGHDPKVFNHSKYPHDDNAS
jgi:N-acyl homoserine lactone hydrolase